VNKSWQCQGISSDGTKFIAGINRGRLYTFDGESWTEQQPGGDKTLGYKGVDINKYEFAPPNPYPTSLLNKNRISGYHCFMDQYMRAKRTGYDPLKLPDGTVF